MDCSIQKTTKLVHDLGIYHDGSLPLVKQEYHQPTIEILRCSHWLISVWNHGNLSAPYWRLYWNQDTGAVARLNSEDYELDPDHLVLIAPGTPFRTFLSLPDEGASVENVMVGCPYDRRTARAFQRHEISGAVRHFFTHFTAGNPYDGIGAHMYRMKIDGFLRRALEELTQARLGSPGRLNHRQSLAQMALIHYALARVPEDDWPETPTDRRILHTMQRIENSLRDSLKNEELATEVGLTPGALTRVFKQWTGLTPMEYLRQKRIEKASILLHHTDTTIEQIADECGFCNRHYFSKVFAEIHGVGPATYRGLDWPDRRSGNVPRLGQVSCGSVCEWVLPDGGGDGQQGRRLSCRN